jgi:hypothetical protein
MSDQRTHGLEDLLNKINNKLARFGKREISYSELEIIYAVFVPQEPNKGWAP